MRGDEIVLGAEDLAARGAFVGHSTSVAAHKAARDQIAVQATQAAPRSCSTSTAANARRRRDPSRRASASSPSNLPTGTAKSSGIATFDEETGLAVVDERAQSADRGRDDRRAARGRFERDEAERLGARRHDAHVGGAVEVGEPIVPLRLDPTNLARDAELVGQPAHAWRLRLAVGSARAADDDERHRRVVERGERSGPRDRHPSAVGSVPTNNNTRRLVEAEPLPRRVAIAGHEHRVVDTGRHDLDPIGIGVVQRRELRALVVGRREHEVGAAR